MQPFYSCLNYKAMKVEQIIGADLSKKTIDLVCHLSKKHLKIDNTEDGFKKMMEWIKDQKLPLDHLMIVMEHTGLYSYRFEDFLHRGKIRFSKVNALAIKRSMGLIRGKNDKLDASRIASYGYEKRLNLKAHKQVIKELDALQLLHSTRDRLVKQRAALLCAIKEYKHIGLTEKDLIVKTQLQLINVYDKQITKLDLEIKSVIANQQSLNENFNLLQTIKGVGPVVATATLIKTKNFTSFNNARKFACYCGTAPFEHSSGTSIKKRSRVSHLADKPMKTLLDQAAKSAIQYDKELKAYYERRLMIGKSKMSTINIVRNKLIFRMFAVIKRQTRFTEDYLRTA